MLHVLNVHARATFSRLLAPVGSNLARAGVTPNAITVAGTVGAVAASVGLFATGWFVTGALVTTVFVLFDMLDGAVARAGGRGSVFGAVLDSSCDRVADAAIFGSVVWFYAGRGERWMVLAALLCLVLGSLTSYIRARAEGVGLTATVGIAERAERLIVILVGTFLTGLGVPFVLAIGLWLLVAASTVTVWQRFATVRHQADAARASAAESAEV